MTRDGRIGFGARVAAAMATALVLAVTVQASAPPAETPGAPGFLGVDGGAPLYLEPPPGDLAAAPLYGGPPPPGSARQGSGSGVGPVGARGIPASVLVAYQRAAARIAGSDPGCGLSVALLAAIGRVESRHARGGAVDRDGRVLSPIIGLRLDGAGPVARITDTDGGRLDGDRVFDRAVGPMQFIPATWARWGADGSGDGVRDPQNVHDAALAAGHYLCAGDRRLSRPDDLRAAILSYNGSGEYLRVVLGWMDVYERGTRPVDDARGGAPVLLAVSPVAVRARHEVASPATRAGSAPDTGRLVGPSARPVAAPITDPAPSPRPAAEPAAGGGGATPTGRGEGSGSVPPPPSGPPSSGPPPEHPEPSPSSSEPAPSTSQPPAGPAPAPPVAQPPSESPPASETCATVRRVVDPVTGAVHELPEPVCLNATDQHRIRDEGGAVVNGTVTGVPLTNPVLRSVLRL